MAFLPSGSQLGACVHCIDEFYFRVTGQVTSSALRTSWEQWWKPNKLYQPRVVIWYFKGVMCERNELSLSLIAPFFDRGEKTLQWVNTKASSWEIKEVKIFYQLCGPYHETRWRFWCIRKTHSSNHTFSLACLRRQVNIPFWKRFLLSSYSQKRWMWIQEYKGEVKGWFASTARAPAGCKNVQWLMDAQWFYKTCPNSVQALEGFLPLKNPEFWHHSAPALYHFMVFKLVWCLSWWLFYSSLWLLVYCKRQALWFLKQPANLKTDTKAHCSLSAGERGFQISAHPSLITGESSHFSTGSRASL